MGSVQVALDRLGRDRFVIPARIRHLGLLVPLLAVELEAASVQIHRRSLRQRWAVLIRTA